MLLKKLFFRMVSVIIPNFNGIKELETLYVSLSLQTFKDFQVILADNGSSDGSVEFTEKKYPQYKILKLGKNLGFSKAVNAGIKYSLSEINSDYLLLLNNDIELKPDFIERAMKTFSEKKDAGFIAVKMLNFFQRDLIDDTGDFIKAYGGSPLVRGRGEKDTGQYDKPEYVFGACAGAAFYRKELFLNAGMFDEDFFAYLEDVDLSFRFQLAGYKCFYDPEIICYHKRGETTKKFSGWETYYSEKNLVSLRLKNYPAGIYIKYSPLFFLFRVRRFYKFFFHYPPGVFRSAFTGYLKGLSEIPSALRKRKQIQNNKKVSAEYIESMFI